MKLILISFFAILLHHLAGAQAHFLLKGDSIPSRILKEVIKQGRIGINYKGFFLLNIETGETPHLIINVWPSIDPTVLLKYPPSFILYYKGYPFVVYTGIENLITPDSTFFYQSLQGIWSRLYTEENWNKILARYKETGRGSLDEDDSGSYHFFYYGANNGSLQLIRRRILGQVPQWPHSWLPKPGPPGGR